ncbi:MAG: alpha/beta hydrolase, partial [Bacteroidia bacterium]|nr:alpha/beta hydrolase [Bacteroidia bacterium]
MLKNSTEPVVLTEPLNIRGEQATFVNEKYGSHERNTFDLWQAKSETPTPLVIYIHGGGFTGGDKSKYYASEDLVRFLDAGVSVAVINYRFMTEAPFGILASMKDSKRCLQYIRFNAEKYNIDKTRVACSGGSAGAGTSLWLA